MNHSQANLTFRKTWPNRARQILPSALLLLVSSAIAPILAAQNLAIDAGARRELVESLVEGLQKNYVFPEKAKAMAVQLRRNLKKGTYDAVGDGNAFAERLTQDLQSVSKDMHLVVEYSEDTLPQFGTQAALSAEMQAQEAAIMRKLNFGFERIERLPFNVGYLQLQGFAPAAASKSRIASAMTLLADTRALIIDLRENHGGEPETVALLASYFFDERTHLTDFYWRAGDRTEHVWTQSDVDGPRYGAERPVYILLSHDSISAAEGFSYALQTLKRAIIVGETSGGGAHPGDPVRLSDHFSVFVPNGRTISPITKTNWEGVGVVPDVGSDAAQALAAAQRHLLQSLAAKETDPKAREKMHKRIAELESGASER